MSTSAAGPGTAGGARLALPQPGWALRRWRAGDIERLAEIADDPRIGQWMSDTWPMPYTQADARWWIDEGQFANGEAWAIVREDVACGGCGRHPQGGFLRCNVEVGWWLAPENWGQGVASAAARWLVERSFLEPEVHRVFAPVHAGNTRSMRVAEKAGMVLESVQPTSAYKRGHVIDRHLYAAYRR